ncbi:MAG: class I SAM-dependent methyltransferase, partial [Rhodospirillales bacterium]|nr:class I SAM-dependent methyltransferase [Rhodospirillales bacterium]
MREVWDDKFSGKDYFFGTIPNAFLVDQAMRFSPGMSALCVADGEGRNGVWLAEQGLDVVSVDFSKAGLAKARELARSRGVSVETVCADLLSW